MKFTLYCEGLKAPVGIDERKPEFSWNYSENGPSQAAYRLIVQKKLYIVWDSEWRNTGRSFCESECALEEMTDYEWKVIIKDELGNEFKSEQEHFSTGVFTQEHFQAAFITGGTLLRKSITLKKEIKKATLMFTGLGYCEAYINGKKITNNVLFPSYTIYEKTIEYTVENVIDKLKQGKNTLGLMLGGHWKLDDKLYAEEVYSQAFYMGRCMGICQLNVSYIDGSSEIIGTDDTWECGNSPITFSSVFDGETYDARKEIRDWSGAEFDCNTWRSAVLCKDTVGRLRYSYIPPIKVIEELAPKSVSKIGEAYIVDFGQNFSGWVKISLSGKRGDKIKIRHAEVLYDDGCLNVENLRAAKATDIYICNGEGQEVYEPRFTYHGFRYAEITGLHKELTASQIVGRVVHTSNEQITEFECSAQSLNRIYSAMQWTMRSNMHSIPTDCCQRDERQGWLADAGVSSEFAVLNFNIKNFYRKWFGDIRDTQLPDGSLPLAGAPGWPRETFIWKIGYHMALRSLYLYTGDERTVKDNYASLQKYENYMHHTLVNGLIPYDFYNDWLALEFANNLMVANAFFADFYLAMILFAKVCDDEAGRHLYQERKEQLSKRIHEEFYGKCLDNQLGTGYYGTCDTMAAAPNAMALEYGITPEQYVEKVEEALLHQITKSRGAAQFTTGILTSGILMDCLMHRNQDATVFEMLKRKEYPSFQFMLDHGATTIWERWQYMTGNEMNSHNHPALCCIGTWFLKALCGIRVFKAEQDGILFLVLKPHIASELSYANMRQKTVWGSLRAGWKKDGNKVIYTVNLPRNARAELITPRGSIENLTWGEHVFSWDI